MSENWTFSAIKLNRKGFAAFRKSPGARAWVTQVGEHIARTASAISGESYGFKMSPSRNRARGVVAPETLAAKLDSATNLTLLRALR